MPPCPEPTSEPDRLEVATDQAIAACGGNARDAVKALIVANEFLEAQVKELQAAVSNGYSRRPLVGFVMSAAAHIPEFGIQASPISRPESIPTP